MGEEMMGGMGGETGFFSMLMSKISDPGFIDKAVASPIDPNEFIRQAGLQTGMGDLTKSQDMGVAGVTWGGMQAQPNIPTSPWDGMGTNDQTVNLRNSAQTIPLNQVSAFAPKQETDWTKLAAALKASQMMKPYESPKYPAPDVSVSSGSGKAATYKPYQAEKPKTRQSYSLGTLLHGK